MKQNKLCNCRYYSAGPLEFNSDNNALNWRQQVHDELDKIGCKHLDPTKGMFVNDYSENNKVRGDLRQRVKDGEWDEVADYFSYVVYRDCRSLDLADFVIFNFHDFKTPTFGTHTELWLAVSQKKPLFIICEDIAEVPFWFMGLIKKRQYFYESVEDCINMIKRIDSGEIKIDSKRWKLLKEELR